jgi:serine/threonine protein kinase
MKQRHEAEIPVAEERQWDRVTDLFDLLLGGASLTDVLATESEPEIRKCVEHLWRHHLSAGEEDFLGGAMSFEILPMFRPGQVLLQRFEIEKLLGTGGMGEVYLALDRRMEERVALKTIARLLAPSPSIRRRILAEVQNARRVTHPNVCRIHELFDEGEIVFFTMEYISGRLLPEALDELANPGHAKTLVKQMAEGLRAAHRTGVVHGDFKPANVMVVEGDVPRAIIMDFGLARALDRATSASDATLSVQAGTVDYMAPELQTGASPTVRSDIFAFGKVAQELLPQGRIWNKCTKSLPEERPQSLDPVIRHLGASPTRRYWIAGAAVASAAAIRYMTFSPGPSRIPQLENARILVNGFQALTEQIPGVRLARSLFLTALRQSTRLRAIGDEDVLPVLRRLKPDAGLPIGGKLLSDLLSQLRAAFVIDGDLHQTGGRYTLDLRLLNAGDQKVVAVEAFRDMPGVAAVAQQAALWLRKSAGESDQSLAIHPVAVTQYTSGVPEALQKYYDAMERFAVADVGQAVPLLREAIRLDPNFAQAHSQLAMCINSYGRFDESYEEIERAIQLAGKLPDRERAWIETNYANLTEDPVKMVACGQHTLADYPDEPRSYRVLARVYVRAGDPEEAIELNRKAVEELSPDDPLLRNEWVVNLCEVGRFAEALQIFEARQDMAAKRPYILRGKGLALMGLGRYAEAAEAFEQIPGGYSKWIQAARILNGELESAIVSLEEESARANSRGSVDDRHLTNEFLCGLCVIVDRRDKAVRHLENMVDMPTFPLLSRALDSAAFWASRLGHRAVLEEANRRLSVIAAKWPNTHTIAMREHAEALLLHAQHGSPAAEDLLVKSASCHTALLTKFDLGELYASTGRHEAAETYWSQFEARRGSVLARMFPGLLPLAWLNRALSARARFRNAEARQHSQKVLDLWAQKNPGLPIVRAARDVVRTSF